MAETPKHLVQVPPDLAELTFRVLAEMPGKMVIDLLPAWRSVIQLHAQQNAAAASAPVAPPPAPPSEAIAGFDEPAKANGAGPH